LRVDGVARTEKMTKQKSERLKIRSVSDGCAWGWLRHPSTGAVLGTPRPMRIKK